MAFIVNLSSLHELLSINEVARAFATLCNTYSSGCAPKFFQSISNYAWVLYQYRTNESKLIAPYKLGRMDTPEFLKNLLNIFHFLKNNNKFDEKLIKALNDGEFYDKDVPGFALLEDAWNQLIGKIHQDRVSLLLTQSESEPIYLISNTNELNMLKILRLLKESNPEIPFYPSIDLSVQNSQEPIKIAPNIFLCLSYRYQLFKTDTENKNINPNSTSSLLSYIIKTHNLTEATVVSQFAKDLEQAIKVGVASDHIFNANVFFTPPSLEKKLM